MNDKYAINEAKTLYREAYRKGDVEKLLSVYATSGFTDMSNGQASKYGLEAREVLQSRAEELFVSFDVELSVIMIDVVIEGDTAHDYGWHEWILRPKSGAPPTLRRERYFEQWMRELDGSWRISFFLSNDDVREEVGSTVSQWFKSEERVSV